MPPQEGYWKGISKICKKYNIHLILDEIYCGMGRSGKMFNYSWDNINPDFVCVGKNTTSGCIPFSFVMSKKKFEKSILNNLGRVNLGHTFQAHSLGIANACCFGYFKKRQTFRICREIWEIYTENFNIGVGK